MAGGCHHHPVSRAADPERIGFWYKVDVFIDVRCLNITPLLHLLLQRLVRRCTGQV